MDDIKKAAQALLDYIDEELVFDVLDDDGDGYTDCSQSWQFKDLIENLKQAMANPAPAAQELVRKCFTQTDEQAMAEYEKARGIKPEPEMEYHHGGFGYEEEPPFGWGQ